MLQTIKFLVLLLLYSYSAISQNQFQFVPVKNAVSKQKLTNKEWAEWQHKDIIDDSIPGISLDKAYQFLKTKKHSSIIVAVIDSEIDINHDDLKNQIWINKDEIPNNGIDDDNNGYIDDIHGWNYVGTNKGDNVPYTSYEYVRILRKYKPLFDKYNSISDVPKKDIENFKLYQKAYLAYNFEVEKRKSEIARFKRIERRFLKGKSIAKKYFPKENYASSTLDSLKLTISDVDEKESISKLVYYIKYNIDEKWVDSRVNFEKFKINTLLNFDYNDRLLTNDDIHNLNDFPYGNNNVQGIYGINHATQIASLIAATRNNNIGINGINDNVQLMPLSIAVVGNEFDKDITLAIRYAVDNGAKVINMSLGKTFSMYPEWVNEAIKYAEDHDVLIVTSSGNNGLNIDKNNDFPTDNINGIESVRNFIKVGNTSQNIDSTLVFSNSNYGKKNVDIFAPGTRITSLSRSGKVKDTGTSLSCAVVSGIASLLFSYYPNLSASEVKQIIMESGVSYDIDVLKPYARGEKQDPNKVPFSSLSKSGKIVNAYNALLLAEEVSKKKK
ncbi:S8 family serine peptidase [uncultured Kordia sp.]|uniref:S8 family serine peptidase n=1 Tax=uncultured Kordia sp. TaxID=507699 RepID=UPI0026212AF2|nr:S8 family serine peptidase [uncultured Kordia sp.]